MTALARMLMPIVLSAAAASVAARATDLFVPGSWPALASDRQAERVGDMLTVIVYENAVASNSAQNGAKRDSAISGQIAAGSAFTESGSIGLGSRSDNDGQTARAGRMVAQISVTVDSVLPNGDLHIAGEQALKINGETTRIKIRGRIRRADISSGNAILSSRIADAEIDYDGKGFVTRSTKPGLLSRIFGVLGL